MIHFIHMRQKFGLLSHVLFIVMFVGLIFVKACTLNATENVKFPKQVWLEKQKTESGWEVTAWLNSDIDGDIQFQFNKRITDINGNSLTVRKHGNKKNSCCNKKIKLGKFIISQPGKHVRTFLEIKAKALGKTIGDASIEIGIHTAD